MILSDKTFDREAFFTNYFQQFWDFLFNYLLEFHSSESKKDHSNSLFKRSKYIDCKSINACFEKIIPYIRPEFFRGDNTTLINQIFCQFFHPESSNEYRRKFMKWYFDIIKTLPDQMLNGYYQSLDLVVPYIRFARDENEKKPFMTGLLNGVQPIILQDQTCGGTSECIADLRDFINTLLSMWTLKTDFCIDAINSHILHIIYKTYSEQCGSQVKPYGFVNSPPELLHDEVIKMFRAFAEQEYSHLDDFLASDNNCKLLLCIANEVAIHQKIDDFSTMLKFFTMVLNTKSLFDVFVCDASPKKDTKSISIIKDVMNIAYKYVSLATKEDSVPQPNFLEVAQTFVGVLYTSLFKKFEIQETLDLLKEMAVTHANENYASGFFTHTLFHYLISNHETNEEIWSFIAHYIVESDLLSSVASRYAQYLATYIFQFAFEVNADEAISICATHIQRKKRTKIPTPHDFVAESIETILTTPQNFVRERIHSHYKEFEKYDRMLSALQILPLPVLEPQQMIDDAIHFINVFDFYDKCPTPEQQRNAFAPIISFCAILDILRGIPPAVAHSYTVSYSLSSLRLFKAILCQKDNVILKLAFDVLSSLINHFEMKKYLTNVDISNWYSSLLLMMLNEEEEYRNIGFKQAVITTHEGFNGFSFLLAPMMSLCERHLISFSESYISFLMSLPLFENCPNLPEDYYNSLTEELSKNTDIYVKDYNDILKGVSETSNGKSLRARSIELILQLDDTLHWQLVLPAFSALIADELTQDAPDYQLISKVLQKLLHPLEMQSIEAIAIIRSLLMYSTKFQKEIPQQFVDFINSICSMTVQLNGSESKEWSFQLIKLMTDVFIQTYPIIHVSEQFKSFASFLTTNSKKENSAFAPEVINLMSNMSDLLNLYYGKYPYPQGNSFPTYSQPTITDNQTDPIYTSLRTILYPQYKDDEVVISSQTHAGQFLWRFKEISDQFFDEATVPNTEIPINHNEDKVIASISLEEEKSFNDIFNGIVSEYEQDFQETFGMDDIHEEEGNSLEQTLQDIESTYNSYVNNDASKSPKFPRPSLVATNPTAGALTACGRYQINHPNYLTILEKDEHVNVLLKKAQLLNHRLGVKIGIVYVGKGIQNQNQIISTTYEETSPHFQEFLTGIGWPVDLSTHTGYDGGLDLKTFNNGKSAVFYSDFMNEMMFHVAPLIPNVPGDEQQVYKKRHIGNDHIHIVWCENGFDYDSSTITSQFNQAHIIIYPLPTGLFHVELHWRDELPWFGPLRHSIILSKKALPSLARATSMSAMNSFYHSQQPFAYPQNEIFNTCHDIYDNHTDKVDQQIPLERMMQFLPQTNEN